MFVTKLTAVLKPCAAGMFGVPLRERQPRLDATADPTAAAIDTTLNASTDSR